MGAARWLSAAPNFKNFKYFESNQFSVALRYWLGIPIFNSTCKCRCRQIIDVFGDHATTCKAGGGPIHRHDLIRDAIFECCNMAGISASKEITGYQAGQKDRVGDVVLNSFDHGREMLVDATCWSPLYVARIQHSAAVFTKNTTFSCLLQVHSQRSTLFQIEVQKHQSGRPNQNNKRDDSIHAICL